MLDSEWAQLQNGADIGGIAVEGIIGEHVTLTTEKVYSIGQAFIQWIWQKVGKHPLRIAIGTDSRMSGPMFLETLDKAIISMGCDSLNCGLSSTPSLFIATKSPEVRADGAIMITVTGGHTFFNRNGLRFFFDGSDISQEDLVDIMTLASNSQVYSEGNGVAHITNLQAIYSATLREMVEDALGKVCSDYRPLDGLKIVVDAGNGVGAYYVHRVLRPLGADVSDCKFLNPDGRFPNHVPNPEDHEVTRYLSSVVQSAKADLGVIFDSDLDRLSIVDSEGRIIKRNKLVALASAIVMEEHPASIVVTDSITSNGLNYFITEVLGGEHHRYQRGSRNVINEAKRLNAEGKSCWLAAETSGHVAFKDNSFNDDSAYFATKIIIKLVELKKEGKELYSLIDRLPVPKESSEFRLDILDGDYNRVVTDTMLSLRIFVSQIPGWEVVNRNYEGLRVVCNNDYEKGWFHVRQSLHELVMPINIESDIVGGVSSIVKKLKLFFRNVRNIDASCLFNYDEK